MYLCFIAGNVQSLGNCWDAGGRLISSCGFLLMIKCVIIQVDLSCCTTIAGHQEACAIYIWLLLPQNLAQCSTQRRFNAHLLTSLNWWYEFWQTQTKLLTQSLSPTSMFWKSLYHNGHTGFLGPLGWASTHLAGVSVFLHHRTGWWPRQMRCLASGGQEDLSFLYSWTVSDLIKWHALDTL